MKKLISLVAMLCFAASQAAATSWSFTAVPSADVANITADANWFSEVKSKQTRYCYTQALNNEALTANGAELTMTSGLLITCKASSSGDLRIGYKTALWLGDGSIIRITGLTAGEIVKVTYETSKTGTARKPTVGNLSDDAFVASTSEVTAQGVVQADGDVTLAVSGGLFFRSIITGTEEDIETGDVTDNPDNPTDTERGLDYMQASDISTPAMGADDVIWCAPDGSDTTGDGTESAPYYNLQTAVNKAKAGTTIKMKAGTYTYDARININDRNGTHDQYITVMCPDGRAVLDFSAMPYHAHSDNPLQGIRLTSSYWHFYKIDICNASDNGMLIERNKPSGGSASDVMSRTQDAHDNIIEFCNFYKNGDTGLQMKNLASFNYVLNCDAYENKDEGDGDADGFAPKISVGDGNYFFGCRAYNNSDDGYDVFFKNTDGFEDNKTIVFENCLAYENGWIDGTQTKGNMNGFKMGSDQGRMNCVLNRCLAVNNGSKGFDQNHNSGDIIMNNCTGYALLKYGTKGKNYTYRIYEALASGSVCELSNCVNIADYSVTTDNGKGEYGSKEYKNKGAAGNGRCDVSSASLEQTNNWLCNTSNFQSINDPEALIGARLDNGALPWDQITWGHPTENNTQIVDKGTLVPANTRYAATGVDVPAIEYSGDAPDLGAFEQALAAKQVNAFAATGITPADIDQLAAARLSVVKTFGGLTVLSVKGARAAERYTVNIYATDGRLLGRQVFNGTGTAIRVPATAGNIILKVNGNGLNESIKVSVSDKPRA